MLAGSWCVSRSQTQQEKSALDLPLIRVDDAPLKAIDARLFRAIRVGDVAKVGALLAKGANASAQDAQNVTALELATNAPSQSLQILQLLLSHGANINYRGLSVGSTLLISAVVHHSANTTLIRFLLDHGAKVNDPNMHGETPLSLAVEKGAVETVALLLQHGANPNPANLDSFANLTFIDDGQGPGFTSSGNTPVLELLKNWNPKVLDLLATAGADLNSRDAQGFGILHYAVMSQNPDAIRILVSKGVKVNSASRRGYTSLHFAVSPPSGSIPDVEVVRALLKAGADPSLKTDSGKTAEDLLRERVKARGFVDLGNAILKDLNPSAPLFRTEK
jgi:ankyrin repeat protein